MATPVIRPVRAGEPVEPGDLIFERADTWTARVIRIGAAAERKATTFNHCGVVLSSAPGGGWITAEAYAGRGHTQRIRETLDGCVWRLEGTPEQRQDVADGARELLGLSYDYLAIARNAAYAIGNLGSLGRKVASLLLRVLPANDNPATVICSDVTRVAIEAGFGLLDLDYPRWETSPAGLADFLIGRCQHA